MKQTDTQQAIDDLFRIIVEIIVAGVCIGVFCPLLVIMREKDYARKKAKKKRIAAKKLQRLQYLKQVSSAPLL